MTAGTAPTAYDLVATQGADFSIIFSFTQAAGGLTGTTATCSVLNTSGTPAVVSSFTGSLNVTSDTTATFTASLTSAQIATLVATGSTTFRYALNSTKSALVTPWLAGALTFLQPGVGSTTASGSFTITAGSNTISGSLTVAANAAVNVSVTDTADLYAATTVEGALAELPSIWRHTPTRAFLRSFTYAPTRPQSICVMGDSTGDETTEWPYSITSWLGARYPAFTTHYRLWSDTQQGWGLPTTVTTGTAGEAYMVGDGASARMWRAADSATNSITGDISIRVKFQPSGSWASGVAQCPVAKFGSAGQRAWRFEITAAGNLFIEISPDGTTQLSKQSTSIVGFTSGQVGWIRVDVDVDNGASGWNVLFYTSPDGTTWTQLGTTVTTATVTSIFDSNFTVDVGGRNGSALVNGNLYAVDIYNGIAASSPLALSWRAGEMYVVAPSVPTGTGTDCCGNVYTGSAAADTQGITGAPVLTMLNASLAGADLTYFTNSTRFAKIFAGRIKLAIANIGHNHAGLYYDGDLYRSALQAWIAQMTAVQPDVAVVITAQNPEVSPETATQILTQADRARELATVAAVGGHGLVDVFKAFTDTGSVATYTNVDGIHPNTAGQALWLTTLQRFLVNA